MWENITLAFGTIRSNKMRALLTMLGIIIGIMSIITIMMIGDAMTATVTGSFANLGANNITAGIQERSVEEDAFSASISSMRTTMTGTSSSGSSSKSPENDDLMSEEMLRDLKEYFGEDILGVSTSHSVGSAQARDGDLYANVAITGVNEDYSSANSITMKSGRFISLSDVDTNGQAVVVSDKFVNNMFPEGQDPLGEQVKLYLSNKIEIYTIVGVYEYTSMGFAGSSSEQDISTTAYIPVSTAKQDLINKNYSNVTIVSREDIDVNEMTDRLQSYFDSVYKNNKDWKVSVSNMSTILDAVAETLNTISIAIAFIAGISLLVGGIGVMNIMLVSVTERTREIGTRKALGARNSHIQIQFVTEAMIIACIGGIIGLVLGITLGAVVCNIFGVPVTVSALTVIGSVLFSMGIGVVFGVYPANKAAKLDPIEALRYE